MFVSRMLTLGEMAESVNLSPWRLCHLFKAEMGIPPERYLVRVRLKKAKSLLEFSFLNVKEVMVASGFSDASHFTRRFAAAYGTVPSKYGKRAHRLNLSEKQNPLTDSNDGQENVLG
jgi:transcriptional regulator GlxA family with amidase domain